MWNWQHNTSSFKNCLPLFVGLWSCGRITKYDTNTLGILSGCGTVQGIVGLWADVELTAWCQFILKLTSIVCGLVVLWADHKVWYKYTWYSIWMWYCARYCGLVGWCGTDSMMPVHFETAFHCLWACCLVGRSQSTVLVIVGLWTWSSTMNCRSFYDRKNL
jgi:hypothetical protein